MDVKSFHEKFKNYFLSESDNEKRNCLIKFIKSSVKSILKCGNSKFEVKPFGSYALNIATKESDIDLCIILSQDLKVNVVELFRSLEKLVKENPSVSYCRFIEKAEVSLLTFKCSEFHVDIITAVCIS
jgi:DNA polymerase sigma